MSHRRALPDGCTVWIFCSHDAIGIGVNVVELESEERVGAYNTRNCKSSNDWMRPCKMNGWGSPVDLRVGSSISSSWTRVDIFILVRKANSIISSLVLSIVSVARLVGL